MRNESKVTEGTGIVEDSVDLGNGFHQIDVEFKHKDWLIIANASAVSVFPTGTGARSIWDDFYARATAEGAHFTKAELIDALGQSTLNLFIEVALKRGIELIEEDKRKRLNGDDQASTDLESNG